ncbi:MAG: Hsp20/alpha crystallin family protein, partial [Halobacteria archaeon]|nr:Hsp20/alpha crystallin family protein [Halobacteria archaeon]
DEEDDEDDENYFRRERPQRSLSRTVKLPTRVESEEATAAYEDGVLRIRLPKAGSHDGDQIEIE